MSDSRPPITMRLRFPTSPDRPPKQPPALDHGHILRQIRTLRFSPQAARIGRRVPGISTIAKLSGLSFRTCHNIVQAGRMTNDQAIALAEALKAMQEVDG
jgi:hypothetical protein